MNLSKCLLITILGVALLLAVSFLTLYLVRKTTKDEPDEPASAKLEESKLKQDKLEKQLEDNRKDMLSQLEKQREQYLKKSQEKFQEDIRGLKDKFPDLGIKKVETPVPLDLEPVLDVNLPELGELSYYKVKDQKITVTREQRDNVVKFTHQRPVSTFNLESVQIGGKSYPVPRVERVLLITTLSLLSDIGYPYYIIVSPSGGEPIVFENLGDRFEELTKNINSFEESMREKAKEFGRDRPQATIPVSEPLMPEPLKPETSIPKEAPVHEQEKQPISFDLTANKDFRVGTLNFEANVADEFTKYTKYYYLDQNQGFRAKSFTANGKEQIGLPLNKDLHSILVYMLKDTNGPPLVVKITYTQDQEYYRNNMNNTWVPMKPGNLEENLDYALSLLTDSVVINVGRRSDYFRNGSGDSRVEETRDINVYVDTDKPSAGWSTFIHKLEVGGEGGETRDFKISKTVFGQSTLETKITKPCKQVEAYIKSDEANTLPKIIHVQYSDDTSEYLMLEHTKYIPKPEINESNISQKLQDLTL